MIFKNAKIKSIVTLVVAMLLFSCETDINKINELDVENLPSQNAKEITIVRTDSSRIVTIIYAPEVENFYSLEKPYTIFPKGMKVKSFKNYPIVESSLRCNKAKHLKNEQLWIGQDDVEVVNDLGNKLNTEELYWDVEKGKIYTDKDVRITTNNEIIYGKGLTADQDFKEYEILEPKGTIYIDD